MNSIVARTIAFEQMPIHGLGFSCCSSIFRERQQQTEAEYSPGLFFAILCLDR